VIYINSITSLGFNISSYPLNCHPLTNRIPVIFTCLQHSSHLHLNFNYIYYCLSQFVWKENRISKYVEDYIHGSVLKYGFSLLDLHIKIVFKLDDNSCFQLFYPCANKLQFEIISNELNRVSYWKVYYLCYSRNITRLEQTNFCSIQ
jgi:hypothetical protein